MTIEFEGKTLTLTGDAFFSYNGRTLNPNEWVCQNAIDENGNEFLVWWEADTSREELEDCCDWSIPNYIEEV